MKTYTLIDTLHCYMDDEELKEMLLDNGYDEEDITENLIAQERALCIEDDVENFFYDLKAAEKNIDADYFLIDAEIETWRRGIDCWATADSLTKAIQKCINDMDFWKVEETSGGKLIVTGYHHDGTNHYEIYRLKKEPSPFESKPGRRNWRNVHLIKAFGWI